MQSHAVRCTPAHHSRLNEAHLCSLGGHKLGRLERWPRAELVLRFAIGDDEMLHLMREALSGTQRHSAAKTGTHRLSEALTGTHRHSQALKGTHSSPPKCSLPSIPARASRSHHRACAVR